MSFLPLVAVIAFLLGWFMGKTNERAAWNKLIEQGHIPRPRIRRQ